MHAFGAVSFAGEQRWTPEMVAVIEMVAVHPRLAAADPPLATIVPDPPVVPALARNIFL